MFVISGKRQVIHSQNLGSGNQYIPWIHIEDLCNIYIKAIEDSRMVGAYNATAPEHVINKELTTEIAKHLNKPLFLPNVPALVLKMLMGEMSIIALEGSRVSCEKISKLNFNFLYPDLENALDNLINN